MMSPFGFLCFELVQGLGVGDLQFGLDDEIEAWLCNNEKALEL
jgi:hypothetical protein